MSPLKPATRVVYNRVPLINGSTVTTPYYLDKIVPMYKEATSNRTLFPKKKVTFEQDGAPAHSSKRAITELTGSYKVVWGRGVWPGNSPDLNVIENLWSVLQKGVKTDGKYCTRDTLIRRTK